MNVKTRWIVGILSAAALFLSSEVRAQQPAGQAGAKATLPAPVPGHPVVVTNDSIPVTIQGTPTVTLSGATTVNATVSGSVSIDGTPTVNATVSGEVGIAGTPTVNIGNSPTINVGNTETAPVLVRDVDRTPDPPSAPVTIATTCNGAATSETLLFTIPAVWQSFTLTDFVIAGFGGHSTFQLRQPPNGTALAVVAPANQSISHTFGTPIVFTGSGAELKMSCSGFGATLTITGVLH